MLAHFLIQHANMPPPLWTDPQVKEGDRVIYFKYAGDAMETPSGDRYTVLHEQDILAKL